LKEVHVSDNNAFNKKNQMFGLFVLVLTWFAITQFTPHLNKLYDFRSVNPWALAYIRMALMLVVTWAYISFLEKKSFGEGFNIFFKDFGRNLFWAVVFFALAFLAEKLYSALVMKPLIPDVHRLVERRGSRNTLFGSACV